MTLPWHQYILGFLLLVAGIPHFTKPGLYKRIMPSYIPAHGSMVLASGIAEMILGLMLLNVRNRDVQQFAAWGIIIMLVVFLTVHWNMLQNKEASLNLPKWVLILRIPLQFGLIYWAYQYV